MTLVIRPMAAGEEPLLQQLLDEPTIAAQYEAYSGAGGVERLLADPYIPREGVHLAFTDGVPVGFTCCVLLHTERPWTMLRGGVLPGHRRAGIGRALLGAIESYVGSQSIVPGIREHAIAGWEPVDALRALAEPLGFRHDRWFWLMERPRTGQAPEVVWPEGVTVRVLDGSDAMLSDWNDAYNLSFAKHYRYVASPLEHVHQLAAMPDFRADAILLAYRDGRIAGFCRNELHATRGEIGTLGTVPEARGIGLGRALLRWGVGWLEQHGQGPVTLLVDGENEQALGLYRGEGFAVTRTRGLWSRPLP